VVGRVRGRSAQHRSPGCFGPPLRRSDGAAGGWRGRRGRARTGRARKRPGSPADASIHTCQDPLGCAPGRLAPRAGPRLRDARAGSGAPATGPHLLWASASHRDHRTPGHCGPAIEARRSDTNWCPVNPPTRRAEHRELHSLRTHSKPADHLGIGPITRFRCRSIRTCRRTRWDGDDRRDSQPPRCLREGRGQRRTLDAPNQHHGECAAASAPAPPRCAGRSPEATRQVNRLEL
jgi:hypothetical protein